MRRSSIHVTALALVALALAGCSSQGQGGTGSVRVSVAAGALGAGVSGVWVRFTSTTTAQAIQGWTTQVNGAWTTTFQSVPVGTYDVYAKAVDASGTVLYETPAPYPGGPITVTAQGATSVTLVLQQKTTAPPPANNAPYFVSLYANQQQVAPGSAVQLAATAADPDVGDSLTFAWSAQGGAGTFGAPSSTATTSTVTWTPPAGTGAFLLTCQVTDSHGASALLSITITVSAGAASGSVAVVAVVNAAPAVQGITLANGPAAVGKALSLGATATDADGDPMTFAWSVASCAGAFGGQTDSAGASAVTFTPSSQPAGGACVVTVTASDGRGGTGSASLGVTFQGGATGSAPQLYLNVSKVDLANGDRVEIQAVPIDNGAHPGWSYAWSDGLAGGAGGTFTAKTDLATDGSDQWYAPATCALLGSNEVRVAPAVTVTDAATGLASSIAVPVTIHCPPPWKFGVISDTQWLSMPYVKLDGTLSTTSIADDGWNPGTCAVDIIDQVNQQFIDQGVKLVVAVGDLTDSASTFNMDVRAVYTQALYGAGIGFFPLRGNHDSSDLAEFEYVFPQTQSGLQNATPAAAFLNGSTHPDVANVPVTPVSGTTFTVGQSFDSSAEAGTVGRTYSFDYGNARFVLLDQFNGPSSGGNLPASTMAWMAGRLGAKPAGAHGFVFGHKGIITENHKDNLFSSSSPGANIPDMDTFIGILAGNGVRIYAGGHDHMHDLSKIRNSSGSASVTELVAASDSSKFYIPQTTPNDPDGRQTILAQQLDTIGYYVYTVDGPKATVEYYAADIPVMNASPTEDIVVIHAAPGGGTLRSSGGLVFTRRQRFGYGLNGKEFVVAPGAPYTVVQDRFAGTTAAILEGANGNSRKDFAKRPFSNAIDTGWSVRTGAVASDVFTLWGLATPGITSDAADTVAVSLSYDPAAFSDADVAAHAFGVAVKDGFGHWVNAGTGAGTIGAYVPGSALGAWGVDPGTHQAWVVVNAAADFAVARF
ncbi:MAG TPA: metallophosphoesterase [Anaeromyxobacteraceae bacterium]|nr:metallophosphoesterase [Anaeromyxobacteraceae bacterium]